MSDIESNVKTLFAILDDSGGAYLKLTGSTAEDEVLSVVVVARGEEAKAISKFVDSLDDET